MFQPWLTAIYIHKYIAWKDATIQLAHRKIYFNVTHPLIIIIIIFTLRNPTTYTDCASFVTIFQNAPSPQNK